MPANRYEFLTGWRVQGTAEEVYNILVDVPGYTGWWSQVYLDVQEVQRNPSKSYRSSNAFRSPRVNE